ncbi:MAG: hypothetical protein R3B91_11525 [Planctomycetaceae bacterium]
MSQESSNGPSRRPPKDGAPTSGVKDKDNDWGFANEEEEKTLEPRLGVVLVACLLLMFGFVLYNKYQQTKAGSSELVAEKPGETDLLDGDPALEDQESAESSPQSLVSSSPNPSATPNRMFDPFGGAKSPSSEPTLTEDTPVSNPASSSFNPFSGDQVASTSDSPQRSSLPSQAEPSPFNDDPFPESAEPTPQEDLLLADDSVPPPPQQQEMVFDFEPSLDEQEQTSTSDDAQFDPFPESEEVAQSNPEPDPFGFAPSSDLPEAGTELAEQQEPEPLESMDLAMPLAPQSNDPDPFAGGDINEEAPRQTNVEPNPFGDVADLNSSTQAQPVDELAFLEMRYPLQLSLRPSNHNPTRLSFVRSRCGLPHCLPFQPRHRLRKQLLNAMSAGIWNRSQPFASKSRRSSSHRPNQHLEAFQNCLPVVRRQRCSQHRPLKALSVNENSPYRRMTVSGRSLRKLTGPHDMCPLSHSTTRIASPIRTS